MFLFMKAYVFHLALVRYNHYVEGLFGGKKPLLRGATLWKVRSLVNRQRVIDLQLVMFESYEIFLYFSRFVFYIERGRQFNHNYVKGVKFIAQEDFIAEEFKESLGSHHASTFFSGLYVRHFFGLGLPVCFFGSSQFWKFTALYFLYFVHSFIQKSPKKFIFAKSWVS